ncbi:MAG: hypothetical protein QM581_05015 [Pseudomonas sp.]
MKAPPEGAVPAPDFKLRFIDWAKQHGHNPRTGAAAFVALQSERDLRACHPGCAEGADPRALLRQALEALAAEQDIAVQFPPIYAYRAATQVEYRYSLMLVLAEDGVEWTARVWRGLDYQGVLIGRGRGPRTHYTHLARMAIEYALDRPEPSYAGL